MSIEIGAPTEDEKSFGRRLTGWLSEHARDAGHPFDNSPFQLQLSEDGQTVAGYVGYRLYDWLFVQWIAVAPEARGRGHGAKLVRAAEDKARAEGILGIFIDSYGFQAPKFYEKLGYTVFGRLEMPDPQLTRYYIGKALHPSVRIG
ncbi:GNAT family N-acetyltransferase [Histidinibacterium aquaticum]|uniref:GNAT family N-acetyltransferase n=1 Tax=Histidinibacterium aquaticum TaxID=2613962 RepID=A0A5J5GG20_9RHOB|nr:GNAT family N-acetyltransferase [Histidinibacterium aquaticum]KAA9007037.1 GNAT family N-acetyltransferase [Histidinibacterium aquaticum]